MGILRDGEQVAIHQQLLPLSYRLEVVGGDEPGVADAPEAEVILTPEDLARLVEAGLRLRVAVEGGVLRATAIP